MAISAKREYPRLLPPGLHEMTLVELRVMCVDAFPLSSRREPIMRSLEGMCTAISLALLRTAVWVDGSFVTEKIEPDDVDVVVALNHVNGNNTPDQLRVRERIERQEFTFPVRCDSYLLMEYPTGHPDYWIGEYMHAYWLRQFGFARNNALKGMALIRTPIA